MFSHRNPYLPVHPQRYNSSQPKRDVLLPFDAARVFMYTLTSSTPASLLYLSPFLFPLTMELDMAEKHDTPTSSVEISQSKAPPKDPSLMGASPKAIIKNVVWGPHSSHWHILTSQPQHSTKQCPLPYPSSLFKWGVRALHLDLEHCKPKQRTMSYLGFILGFLFCFSSFFFETNYSYL